MKTMVYMLLIFLVAGCSQKPKMIPEKEMKKIMKESILADAYLSIKDGRDIAGNEELSFFQPILEKFGYTVEDMKYSLGRYSQRKTDVLSMINQQLIDEFKDRKMAMDRIIEINKAWDELALKHSADTVFFNASAVSIHAIRDTSNMKFDIPFKGPGTYRISFNYTIDSLDQNRRYQLVSLLTDSEGEEKISQRWNNITTIGEPAQFTASQEVSAETYVGMRMIIRPYLARDQRMKEPRFRIDSLMAVHYPPIEKARDNFIIFVTRFKPFNFLADEFIQKDSLALRHNVRPPYKE